MLRAPRLRVGRGGRLAARSGALTALAAAAALGVAAPASADAVRDSEAWVLAALNVQQAWQVTQGHGVIVAVIDSGVNANVSDLTGAVISGPDLTEVHTSRSNPNWGKHGTWMASLIAGHGHGEGSGIIGTAPAAKVLSIRVITDKGDPGFRAYEHEPAENSQEELAHAIRLAVADHAGVISMSLGYSLQSEPVREALQVAYDHNVVVVASAGNSEGEPGGASPGQAPYSFPANYPGVLAVGALTQSGALAGYSSNNLSVQVAAPGSAVPAQGRDGKYWIVTGTSPACALTAGVVALVKAAYPDASDTQVIDAITSSTTPSSRPPGGYNDRVGFGEVNAAAAIAAAGRITAAKPPATGIQPTEHFGGGPAAIPAPPVAPRGRTALILYCLLGAASLALIGFAVSRLFALRDRGPAEAGPPPAPRSAAGPPGRHAAPRRPPGQPLSALVEAGPPPQQTDSADLQ